MMTPTTSKLFAGSMGNVEDVLSTTLGKAAQEAREDLLDVKDRIDSNNTKRSALRDLRSAVRSEDPDAVRDLMAANPWMAEDEGLAAMASAVEPAPTSSAPAPTQADLLADAMDWIADRLPPGVPMPNVGSLNDARQVWNNIRNTVRNFGINLPQLPTFAPPAPPPPPAISKDRWAEFESAIDDAGQSLGDINSTLAFELQVQASRVTQAETVRSTITKKFNDNDSGVINNI